MALVEAAAGASGAVTAVPAAGAAVAAAAAQGRGNAHAVGGGGPLDIAGSRGAGDRRTVMVAGGRGWP